MQLLSLAVARVTPHEPVISPARQWLKKLNKYTKQSWIVRPSTELEYKLTNSDCCQRSITPEEISLESVQLLGVRFHKLIRLQLLQHIVYSAKFSQKTIIAHVNIHAMNLAYHLEWFRDFLNQADVVFVDGVGIIWGARLAGRQIKMAYRLTCSDWIEALALACQQNGLSLFLLGGKSGVAEEAVRKFKIVAPNLKVSTHHGYFQKTGPENDQIIAQINAFKPDVLYVGFGMPLQEEWIKNNADRVDAKVVLALGACLDFYTGTRYRAPRWLTDYGLEWVGRLVTEPRRLWARYLIGNPLFFWRILRQRLTGR